MPYFLRFLAVSALCAGAAATARSASPLYVNAAGSGQAHDGHSWSTAFLTPDDALQAAQAGDSIWVARGTYDVSHVLPAGVRFIGSFAGDETDVSQRHGGPGSTVLHAKSQPGAVMTIAKGAGPDTVLQGCTVESLGVGACISMVSASPTILNNVCTRKAFYWNTPLYQTSSMLYTNGNCSPIIVGNVFRGSSGHAVDCGYGDPIIVNNTIVGNEGGGIVLYDYSRAWIANNIIAQNGFGISAMHPDLTVVRNNCFFENVADDYTSAVAALPTDGSVADRFPVFANISADPHFAAPRLGDYHIQPDSPCVNAGADEQLTAYSDMDYQTVYPVRNVDIGADESDGRVWNIIPTVVRVSTTGDDANDGSTWALAKRTLAAAGFAVRATGGEVWVAEGVYADDTPSYRTGSTELSDYVSFYGGFDGTETTRANRDWKAHPTIVANHQGGNGVFVSSAGRWSTRVDGFTIQANRYDDKAGGVGIRLVVGSPVISNCVLTASGQDAPLITGSNASPLIENTTLTDYNGAPAPVNVSGFGPVFRNNVFRNLTAAGDGILRLSGRAAVVKDNLFDSNLAAEGKAFFSAIPTDGQIVNNTFVHNRGGVYLASPWSQDVVANNIFYFNTPDVTPPATSSPRTRNNCIYPAGGFPLRDSMGNLGMDPRFVDAEHGDYRLTSESPCVDTGDSSLVKAWDVDLGNGPRILGRRVDIGGYESAFKAPAPDFLDVLSALKIAAGLQTAAPDDMQWLNADPSRPAIDAADALALLRELPPAN